MSCSPCGLNCGVKQEYYSLAINNPLYYTQTIGEITKFYQGISTSTEYCEWPDCERIANWSNYTSKEAAIVSNTVDNQGNYILTVAVNDSSKGMHGYYLPPPDDSSNYTCSDGLSFTQKATIFNNGTGTTIATLNSFNESCCACSYSAIYNADNPFEQIPWNRNSDGCSPGPGYIVCSPDQSYVTIAPTRNTLCLPPNCPNSIESPPVTINMSKEITAKDFLAEQQKVIDIKKTFSINWSTYLSDPGRTIPNPIEGGRFIRFKPSLSTDSLDKKNLKIEIKNEDCDLLETFTRSINASSGSEAEVQVNIAKYAITSEENASWGPNQIGKRIVFQVSEI